jgi:hypothetical protein
VPATASFEEREPPFRAIGDPELRIRLEAEEARARAVIAQVVEHEPEAIVPWTGRQMMVAKFVPHLRSEFALHRWDIIGDDEVSAELLGQAELTEHAVTVLGQILMARGKAHDPCPGADFRVRLRAPGARDLLVVVESDVAQLELVDKEDEPDVELDAAARTLVIWGRRPTPPGRIRSHLATAALARLQALLSGY